MKIEKTFTIEIDDKNSKFCGKNCEYLKDGWCSFYKVNIIKYYNDGSSKDLGRFEMCFREFGMRPKEEQNDF